MRFVNSYTPTKDLMREYYSSAVYPHRIAGAAAAFAAAVAMTVIFFLLPSPKPYYICLPIIAAFLLAAGITILISPRLCADTLFSKSAPKPTTVSFGDDVYVNEFGYEIRYDLAELTDIKETRSMFVLFFGSGSAVIVKKGAFTVGNDRDFVGFLKLIADKARDRQKKSDKI